MKQNDGFIDPHGGFRNLKSYQIETGGCGPRQLENQFLKQGGFTERLYRSRQNARRRY